MTTAQQKYLIAFGNMPEESRSAAKVAQMLMVNRSTVSRALRIGIEEGYLTEEFAFTVKGQAFVKDYVENRQQIAFCLEKHGVPKDRAFEDAGEILASGGKEVIEVLKKEGELYSVYQNLDEIPERNVFSGDEVASFFHEGTYEIPFLFQKDRRKGVDMISMANDGFEHPGKLVIAKKDSNICLKRTIIQKKTPLGNFTLKGKMSGMRYQKDGKSYEVPVYEDVVCIPMAAMEFYYSKAEHLLQGSIRVFLSCSVGNMHMPAESPSVLTIYL